MSNLSVKVEAKTALWFKAYCRALSLLRRMRLVSPETGISLAQRMLPRALKYRVDRGQWKRLDADRWLRLDVKG